MNPRRRQWLLVRMAIYLAVIAGVLLYRGGVPWKRFVSLLGKSDRENPTLTVAGRDLAPPLLERLAVEYQHDYPALTFSLLPGGTNQALEALLSREADVAFLYRQLTSREQNLFREADGDTAIVVPVGVGGLVLLAGAGVPTGPLTIAALREAFAAVDDASRIGREPATPLPPYCSRIYACDPNEGSWDALFSSLGLPAPPAAAALAAPRLGPVVFLADPAEVVAAIAADPQAWGLVSTLDGGLDPAAGLRCVGVVVTDGMEAVSPAAATIATGDYPLYHFLYAACRGAGSLEGGKFITHLASPRALRQVERAGVVPARQVAREIQLTRDPVGGQAK